MTIEELTVKMDADLARAEAELKKITAAVTDLGKQSEETGKKTEKMGSILKAGSFVGLGVGIAALGKKMVQGNAEMEKYTTQFSVLLKSTDAAQKRIGELRKFAADTPFELPEVVQASKLLQTFGGTALATGKSLTMVGDMAAASGANFEEIATWVGRAYTNIQSGRPFGEAAVRMQELGLMSGETRNKLEEMQKAGKSSAEVWAEFQKSMGPYEGMMAKQSQTLEGLMSTLSDNLNEIINSVGKPLFDLIKKLVKVVLDVLANPAIQKLLEKFVESIGAIIGPLAESLTPIIEKLVPIITDILGMLSEGFVQVLQMLMPLVQFALDLIVELMPVVKVLFGVVMQIYKALEPFIKQIIKLFVDLLKPFLPLIMSLAELLASLVPVLNLLVPIITAILTVAVKFVTAVVTPIVDAIKFIVDTGKKAVDIIGSIFGGGEEQAAPAPMVAHAAASAPEQTSRYMTPEPGMKPPPPPPKKGKKKEYDELSDYNKARIELESDLRRKLEMQYDEDMRALQKQLEKKEISQRVFYTRVAILDRDYVDGLAKIQKEAADKAREETEKQIKAEEKRKEFLAGIQTFIDDQNAKKKDEADRIRELEIENEETEEDRIDSRYRYDEQRLLESLMAKEISEKEYQERREKLDREYTDAITENRIQQAQQLVGALGEFAQAAFGDTKAIAIAQAIINTYEGATKALAQGGIIGTLLAGAVIATGLANVAKITGIMPEKKATGGMSRGMTMTGEQGDEFVVNAQASRRNRALLEAINSGATFADITGMNARVPAGGRPMKVALDGTFRFENGALIAQIKKDVQLERQASF